MLGHVLRLPENSPAAVLSFSVDGCPSKSRRGRHQINLFNTIKSDFIIRGFILETSNNLFILLDVAKKRANWILERTVLILDFELH